MHWSFQLYSARNFQPWDKVLKMLGELGYKQVEGFGGVYSDPAAMRAQKIAEFRERFASPYVAAERGYIDEVILPRTTRAKLVQALATLDHKRDKNPPKKHGNIPL